MKRITWTIQPDEDVFSLLDKEMTKIAGKRGCKRGLRTKLINDALREAFKKNFGKRERTRGAI